MEELIKKIEELIKKLDEINKQIEEINKMLKETQNNDSLLELYKNFFNKEV